MFTVPGVQREGLPYKEGGRCRAEADTYPLVDTDHVEDDEQVQDVDLYHFLVVICFHFSIFEPLETAVSNIFLVIHEL